MARMHPFDEAIDLRASAIQNALHEFTGATHPAYANMIGPFGGTTSAQLLQSAMLHAERLGDPVALTVNFAAPVADGEIRFVARPVRTNRSTQHWIIEAHQAEGVVATATAVFAVRRETWSDVEAVMPANVPAPDAVARMPVQGMPAWPQRYDMRFVCGGMGADFDSVEQPDSLTRLWLRDEPPRPLDFVSLAAACDCFAPRLWVRRHQRSPAGTVTMTMYFHADAALLAAQGDRPLFGQARAQVLRDGYCDQMGEIWSADGQLLASTQQVQYYKT